MIAIKVLKGGCGDCLLISFNDSNGFRRNILIDGGNDRYSYENHIKPEILSLPEYEIIDLMIVTHIDQDHVRGAILLTSDIISGKLRSNLIAEIWFNSNIKSFANLQSKNLDASFDQMQKLILNIRTINLKWNANISNSVEERWGMLFTVISPNTKDLINFNARLDTLDASAKGSDYRFSLNELLVKETTHKELDAKIENAVSIGLLLELKESKLLFLGDAVPRTIDESIGALLKERNLVDLEIDVVKLSHHGSIKSLSASFFRMIRSRNFIISTDGKKSNLPNKMTLARIINHKRNSEKITFWFNYQETLRNLALTQNEMDEHNFECKNPNFAHGSLIEIHKI